MVIERAEKVCSPLLVIALVVVVFSVLSSIYFVLLDERPNSWDPALHMYYSLIYYKLIQTLNLNEIIFVSNYYPPLVHIISAIIYLFTGFSEKIAILTNIMFYFILILTVFKIAEKLYGFRVGVISAILVSLFPGIIEFQRVYMLDLALTSLFSLSIYFYISSKDFSDLKNSIFFGLTFGLCELTKWNAFIYIVPTLFAIFITNYTRRCPICYKFTTSKEYKIGLKTFCSKKHLKLYMNRKEINRNRIPILNIFVALFVCLMTIGWWYIPNLKMVAFRLIYFANIGSREGDPNFLTLEGWLYYLNAILEYLQIPFFLIFIVSVIWFFKNRLSLSWIFSILFVYIILTLISNKDHRYILPLLPIFSIQMAVFFGDLYEKRLGKLLFSVFIIIGLVNISALTFGFPSINNKLFPNPEYPKKEDWKITEVLEIIKNSGGEGKIVVVLPDHVYLNGQSLEFYRLSKGYKFSIYNGVYIGYDTFKNNFDKIDYIILIEPRDHVGVYGDVEEKLYKYFYSKKENFKNLANFELPDRTNLYIYKRL